MRRAILGLGVTALCLCVSAAEAVERLRVAGTGVGVALMRQLGQTYQAANPGASLWVPDSVGTIGAIRGLAAGKLDVGFVLRTPTADELPGGQAIEICRTPLVFFAAADRKDVTLTRADLPALYNSSLSGFAGGAVRPLLRPPTDTGTMLQVGFFPELAKILPAARERRGAIMALNDQDAMDAVEGSRTLVAFGALAPIIAEQRKITVVPLDGLAGTVDEMAAGRYPYDTPLLLLLGANPSDEASRFVAFARSPQAAQILRAQACLPSSGG
ncbi:putative extracellular solute-binding protein, family 1 [Magnetospirillum gryphiswaldense MSR-1 v2]|uniref:Extracellular solute-binding protein, family 1 n=1 Tax=Magnetospirillum gryphiswaldense (strain DSM 6361 / JCM 21280 / NBRC 15271 / MSR-1) TaxID=431944 RepID=V6EZZ7_MAGGM|nr:substrate-binding domain-containing protein [Magnetospirillum gryphiswaldense]CDK98810.1 putative extracellular solute-binding protein, family 1 [Magnetospirillum gryphiswaldense MSR-1 v2]